MCGSSRLFLIPGSQHLLSTNVFCAQMWPFGYLHLSPPVRMASCLLTSVAQLLGHRGNQPLWPCKCFSIADPLPLLPVPWCTWLMALGSHQPPDFQRTPALDSWLGFLMGHDGRSELASSKRDTLAPQPLWSLQTPATANSGSFAAGVGHSWHPACKSSPFQQGRVMDKIPVTFLLLKINLCKCSTSWESFLPVWFPLK